MARAEMCLHEILTRALKIIITLHLTHIISYDLKCVILCISDIRNLSDVNHVVLTHTVIRHATNHSNTYHNIIIRAFSMSGSQILLRDLSSHPAYM